VLVTCGAAVLGSKVSEFRCVGMSRAEMKRPGGPFGSASLAFVDRLIVSARQWSFGLQEFGNFGNGQR